MSSFSEEQKEANEKIWALINIKKGMKVLDIGVGEHAASVKKLISLGASVTGVDNDPAVIEKHKDINAELVCADASKLPFTYGEFDLSLAFYTLHEIDPVLHKSVISEMLRVSKRIIIVEPERDKAGLYTEYTRLWKEAMNNIGKFEDYRNISYWENLLIECGAEETVCEKLEYRCTLKGDESVKFMQYLNESLKGYGVTQEYQNKFAVLMNKIYREGMIFSDVSVLKSKI